jgi:selenocysteine-specific elongation factor
LLIPVQRIDARIRLLADSPVALAQNDQVDLFAGAAELPAWITLLDRERLDPGDSGWVQFRFRRPLAVLKGDRFIIRRPSPSLTIGGGEVIDPNPVRHRRFRPEVLSALETLAAGSPDEIVLQQLTSGPVELRALRQSLAGLSSEQVDGAIEQLIAEGDVVDLSRTSGEAPRPGDFLAATATWERLAREISAALAAHHADFPLRRGMPREALKGKLALSGPPRLLDDVFRTAAARGLLIDEHGSVRAPSFAITLDGAREAAANRYLAALRATPLAPPAPADLSLDAATLGALDDLGRIVKVAEGIYFAPEVYAKIEAEVIGLLERQGTLTLAQFRDHFQTSRKYAQALLEYLDQRRITRRVGDERVRYSGAGAAVGGNR